MRKTKRLSAYLLGRSILLSVLLPIAAYFMLQFGNMGHVSFKGFFVLTGASFLVSLITALSVRFDSRRGWISIAQPAWDITYATCLLYLSGGWFSPFVFLYLLAILGAALLFSLRGALAAATFSSFLYGLLSILQIEEYLRPLNPFLVELPGEKTFFLRMIFNLVAFYAVAVLSGYLTEELRKAGEKLEKAHDEIMDLELLQGAILRSMGSGLIAADLTGRVMFFNKAAETMLVKAGLNPDGHSSIFTKDNPGRNEVEIHTDGGMILGYSVVHMAGRDGGQIGKIISFQDLTEVRRLSQDLARADRMAAVGRLAAGLAHEIRNPLASLSGSVQMLDASVGEKSEEQKLLFTIISREAERLNNLVRDFLGYARPGEPRRSLFSVKEFFDELGFFLKQGEGKKGFELILDFEPGLEITADRDQLQSLFLNLFRNSMEAADRDVRIWVGAKKNPGGIDFKVSDDGPGISPEIAERAFEPFVSNKPGGTGLGLATVHRIVSEHGGTISLSSPGTGGLTFRITLPG